MWSESASVYIAHANYTVCDAVAQQAAQEAGTSLLGSLSVYDEDGKLKQEMILVVYVIRCCSMVLY